MQIILYYLFIPTRALTEAALAAGREFMIESDVWIDVEHDRTGAEHSQAEIEEAAWTVFLAKLVNRGPESQSDRHLREECLRLGFKGCWSVYVARSAEPVKVLLEDALAAAPLAAIAAKL